MHTRINLVVHKIIAKYFYQNADIYVSNIALYLKFFVYKRNTR